MHDWDVAVIVTVLPNPGHSGRGKVGCRRHTRYHAMCFTVVYTTYQAPLAWSIKVQHNNDNANGTAGNQAMSCVQPRADADARDRRQPDLRVEFARRLASTLRGLAHSRGTSASM